MKRKNAKRMRSKLTVSHEEHARHWREVIEPRRRREFAARLNRAWAEAERTRGPIKLDDIVATVRVISGKPFTARLLSRWRLGLTLPDRYRIELLDALGQALDLGEEGGGWLQYGSNDFNLSGVPAVGDEFGSGFHIAPFLSRRGAVVLVSIDTRSRFRFSSSASSVTGPILGEIRQTLLPRGIHRAPWVPYDNAKEGIVLLAIDAKHRLVAQSDAADPLEARAVAAKLAAKLNHQTPAGS